MKIQVTHDREGNVLSIAVQTDDEGELQLLPDEGAQMVSEVDYEGDAADLADEEGLQRALAEFAERYQVDMEPRRRKLVKRK
jgi:hypothetical protein